MKCQTVSRLTSDYSQLTVIKNEINRHNYEEYFILYMDNELGSEERRMVEAFVQQHPDLKEELDNLLQYKLAPDTDIVFDRERGIAESKMVMHTLHEAIMKNGAPFTSIMN